MPQTRRKSDSDRPADSFSSTETPNRDPESVARRAYERYEARGYEDGHDMDDWLEAERELMSTDTQDRSES
jgi:hypothetical protein